MKFHVQFDVLLFKVNLGMSPPWGLIRSASQFHGTAGAARSPPPSFLGILSPPGAGLRGRLPWKGGHRSPRALPEGFSLPALLERLGSGVGFGCGWISAGAAQCSPVLVTDPRYSLHLKLP